MMDELHYQQQIDRLESLVNSAGLTIQERAEVYRVRNFIVALLIEGRNTITQRTCPKCAHEYQETATGELVGVHGKG